MFPFPGYHPRNPSAGSGQAQPGQKLDAAEPVPDTVRALAINQGGEYIHPKTRHIYKWSGDDMCEAYPPNYESWWRVWGELPAGELEEL